VREGDVRRVCRSGAQGVAAALLWQCRRGMAAEVRYINDRLSIAARRGDVADISLALLAGANVNANEGTVLRTPLLWAATLGRVAAVEALLAAGAHVDSVSCGDTTPLMGAAGQGHAAAVSALLATGADVHRVNCNGDTALHHACLKGRMDCARVLLEAGARMDVRNHDGKRPIDEVSAALSLSDRAPSHVIAHAALLYRCARGLRQTSPLDQPSPRC